MNIVFLDIDGVLCNPRVMFARPRGVQDQSQFSWIDPICVAAVNRITTEANAMIVVSSSWRVMEDIEIILRVMGLTGRFHDDPVTPGYGGTRGDFIRMWMDKNGIPDNYVIFDDNDDFHEDQKPHLVQTDIEDGILARHIRQALEIFGIRERSNLLIV